MTSPAMRRAARVIAALALFVVAADAVAQEPPRVRLIATGGTISNRPGGRLTHQDLVQSIPDLTRHARVESEQFANVASSQLTLDQWLQLARRIKEVFAADAGLAGVVVTCGTDTLEEIAYFLNLTVLDVRPVVLVGSMRSPGTLGYDGAANLLDGIRVAGDPASRDKGALVVLNDQINAAREVTKTDALRLHTFDTRGYGVLGVVERDRVVYYRDVVKRHTAGSEFDLGGVTALPRVDIIMVYQDAPGDLIRAAVDQGARGLVIAGAGAGSTSGTQADALRYAADKGVFTIIGTRTGAGRIPAAAPPQGGRDGDPARRRFTLGSEDLTPLKARVLLMLALTRSQEPREIARIFTEY